MQTIHEQYKTSHVEEEEIVLLQDSKRLDPSQKMAELDIYGDHIIALEAVRASEIAVRTLPRRQPLQPANHQIANRVLPNSSLPQVMLSPGQVKVDPFAAIEEKSLDAYLSPHASSPNRDSTHSESVPVFHSEISKDENCTLTPQQASLSATISSNKRFDQPSFPTVSGAEGSFRTSDVMSFNRTGVEPDVQLTPEAQISSWAMSNSQAHDGSSIHPTMGRLADNPPFARFLKHWRSITQNPKVMAESDIIDRAWLAWASLPDVARKPFFDNVGISGLLSVECSSPSRNLGELVCETKESLHDLKAKLPLTTHEHVQPTSVQLQSLVENGDLGQLESGVEKGVRILEDLKTSLSNDKREYTDAFQWIKQIDNLQKQAVTSKTIIGVVGSTGAGKSSALNALLDEERLVPTNCMRACTAVVTEISYNNSAVPYRAEIEFITVADWQKELRALFQDLFDANGQISRECYTEDSDAAIAYAKIRAVYPNKTKEDILKSNTNEMLNEVAHILGGNRIVEHDDSLLFYRRLQDYVDSKEKNTSIKDKANRPKEKKKKEMEYWPLIRVVRIYVKSPALSTGAVVVDLPGVHDSNAARAAVADGYMKQCTGLWIVAPVTRAVDDKAAKTLLGESFKRQLKMDGGFNSVTFICSKTDDISIMEAQDSLGLDEDMTASWELVDAYIKKQKTLKMSLEESKESRASYGEAIAHADDQLEIWEAFKDSIEDGKTVYAPSPEKRKKSSSRHPRKRQRHSSIDPGTDSESNSNADEDEDTSEEVRETGCPLTEDLVTSKISELRSTKKEARRQRVQLDEHIKQQREEIAAADEAEKQIHADMAACCISGRNEYSRGAIQQDFAAGIKELDQELAAERNEENFNPDDELRDYEQVASSLPVFCVSSRAYQKLQGRLAKDAPVPGFRTVEETEIPQLQAHCRKITEAGRKTNSQRFLTNLNQLTNSLHLWASNDGAATSLTHDQRTQEAEVLQKCLRDLGSSLDEIIGDVCKQLMEEFLNNIYDKYPDAVGQAIEEASRTADQWGAAVNRNNRLAGGYHYMTYKAITRRNGLYSNGRGPHDWNGQLADPMLKIIASGWEKTFARRIGIVMATFTRNSSAVLRKFHADVQTRCQKTGTGLAGLNMLQQQLRVYENILKEISNTARESINTSQKDINREFTPVIEKAMIAAYEACAAERGIGSYMRMKHQMTTHVDQARHNMFRDSTEEVEHRLSGMLRNIKELLSNKVDEVTSAIKRDYWSVICGTELKPGDVVAEWQLKMKENVRSLALQIDELFKEGPTNASVVEVDKKVQNFGDNDGFPTTTDHSPRSKPGLNDAESLPGLKGSI